MTQPVRQEPGPLAWISLGVVYVVWGSTYLAIRVGVRYLPPATFSGVRFLVAGALLYMIAQRTGGRASPRPGQREWFGCAIVGTLLLFGGNGGVSFAEQRLDSGFAAVLVATIPLWMIVMSATVERSRPAWSHLLGVASGLAGVAVLAAGTKAGSYGSIVVLLFATLGWSLGSVLAKRVSLPGNIMLSAAMQMLFGGAVLVLFGTARGEWGDIQLDHAAASAWVAFVWLVLAGSILAYSAYGYALTTLPLPTVATYAYINPVVAILLGLTIGDERLTTREIVGSLIVVASVGLTVRQPAPVPTTSQSNERS
jgi:drug/metabolite transporter (DMT)-like permease